MSARSFDTPTGRVTLTEQAGAITGLTWGDEAADDSPLLRQAGAQVEDYFAGKRQKFDLPLRVHGNDFQRAICASMQAIPFGQTSTYGDLARDLGVPAQAVGQGRRGHPIPILIPCHRVLGARGLGGFSGGIGVNTKVALLRLEGAAGLLI